MAHVLNLVADMTSRAQLSLTRTLARLEAAGARHRASRARRLSWRWIPNASWLTAERVLESVRCSDLVLYGN